MGPLISAEQVSMAPQNWLQLDYRFKTVRTVLAVLQSEIEPLFMIEVTVFSNIETSGIAYGRSILSLSAKSYVPKRLVMDRQL
ncbi:MAG TPA: hypothetical protein DIU00_10675 [Phycisphaerales bacterium]|nr:hypothetical protein [Phycisphaerales bacterium]